MRYLGILTLLIISIFFNKSMAKAEDICITEKDTVDLITLLDSSERSLAVRDSCKKLVKDLYATLDTKDKAVESLTKELITSKQDTLKYKAANSTWKTWALVTTASTVVLLFVSVAPAL